VLLTLDDADRADDLTHELLRVLCARLAEFYIEGAVSEPPALAIIVTSTTADDIRFEDYPELYESQELAPLSDEELGTWFGELLPQVISLSPEFIKGVMRLTSGLPGLVVALLGALVEQGKVRVHQGTLVVDSDALSADLPDSLSDALAARESRLSKEALVLLRLLRVLDHAVPKRLLTLLVDQDEATLEESLGSLVSRALVGVSDQADQAERSYCAEGAGTTLNDEQRRISHARIGRVLMGLGVRQGVPGLGSAALAKHLYFAVHYGEEELREAAQHSLKSAMEEAVLSHDGAGEARLSEWLIEFAESAQEARFYRLQRGRLFQRLGQFGDAINAFEAVLNEKDSSMGDRDAATLGIAGVHIDRGDFKKAIERASTIKPGRQAYPAALGRKAKALLLTGKNDEALKVCETGLALKPDAGIAADLGSTQALVH
jgi:tetratricopeptide (TPR) repeat protein